MATLADLITEAGLRKTELANETGLNAATITRIAHGEATSTAVFRKIEPASASSASNFLTAAGHWVSAATRATIVPSTSLARVPLGARVHPMNVGCFLPRFPSSSDLYYDGSYYG